MRESKRNKALIAGMQMQKREYEALLRSADDRIRVLFDNVKHQEDRHVAFVESVMSMTFLDRVRFAITGRLE